MSTQSKGQSEVPPSTQQAQPHHKSHELLTCTVKSQPFSYVHLELARGGPAPPTTDILQFRSYCTSALQQFLGATGVAISIDMLKVDGNECWIRIPRQDLGAFAAAITAWPGTLDQGEHVILRIRQCSDWLGSMVGADGQDKIWVN